MPYLLGHSVAPCDPAADRHAPARPVPPHAVVKTSLVPRGGCRPGASADEHGDRPSLLAAPLVEGEELAVGGEHRVGSGRAAQVERTAEAHVGGLLLVEVDDGKLTLGRPRRSAPRRSPRRAPRACAPPTGRRTRPPYAAARSGARPPRAPRRGRARWRGCRCRTSSAREMRTSGSAATSCTTSSWIVTGRAFSSTCSPHAPGRGALPSTLIAETAVGTCWMSPTNRASSVRTTSPRRTPSVAWVETTSPSASSVVVATPSRMVAS